MDTVTSLYQRALPSLQKMEKWRKKYLFARYLGIGAMLLLLIVFFVIPLLIYLVWLTGFLPKGFGTFAPWHAIGAVYIFIPLPFVSMIAMGFAGHFSGLIGAQQQKILLVLLKEIDPTLRFQHTMLERQKLTKSGFFDRGDKKNKVYSTGYGVIEGTIENVKVEFADTGVVSPKLRWYMLIPGSGTLIILIWFFVNQLRIFFGKRKDLYMYGFKGLFFIADFNKKIHGFTLVLPDAYEKYLGFLAPAIQDLTRTRQGQLAYLEDPRFEKEFVVYTTDQIEARYVLSTSFMERIIDLKHKLGRPLLLSFSDNQMYLAIPDPDGIFQISLRQNVLNPAVIEKPYNDLMACREIVNELKLNRKIWG